MVSIPSTSTGVAVKVGVGGRGVGVSVSVGEAEAVGEKSTVGVDLSVMVTQEARQAVKMTKTSRDFFTGLILAQAKCGFTSKVGANY